MGLPQGGNPAVDDVLLGVGDPAIHEESGADVEGSDELDIVDVMDFGDGLSVAEKISVEPAELDSFPHDVPTLWYSY